MNTKQYVDMIKNNETLLDKNGKISSDDLTKILILIDDVSVKNDIIKVLDSDGFIKTKKGATTYSPIMRFFYNLITEGQLMQDLSKNGKATIELPEGLKDSINQNENGHWTFFNTLNQEIKLNCNFDNLEVKKAKAKLEKQNRELEKNMNKKS